MSVAVADFNGDGLKDIAVGREAFGIRVLWQDAQGRFTAFTDLSTVNAYRICAGDFNNDGRSDLAGIGAGTSQVDVFSQTTNGTLAPMGQYSASYYGFNDLETGDVDGDGLTDIVVMNGQDGFPNVSLLLQTNGGFSAPILCNLGLSELPKGVGIGEITATRSARGAERQREHSE